ncbi:MAG: two-component sensor histidine kinase [Cardiobacteriales bacterium]|nr:MAG: two-component sensor histidine kinase [Cardiobacteriales bacterium]
MSTRRLAFSRVVWSLIAGVSVISMTLFAIYMLSEAATQPQSINKHYITLLVIAVLGLVGLTVVIFWQIIALFRHLRRQSSGARLSFSFALSMLTTTLLPIAIIAFFSWQFLSYNLGQTFNSRVSSTLSDALQLTRTAITMRAREALDDTRSMSQIISSMTYGELVDNIEKMRRSAGALEIAVFDQQGNIVAFAHENLAIMTVEPPSPAALIRVSEEQEYFEFASYNDEYIIRVLSDINKLGRNPFYLQTVYTMPESFNSLASSVRESYQQHQTFNYLQPHITTSLVLVLTLILLLTILIAFWLSVLFGEHMTRPLRILMKATRKIADGDFSGRVEGLPNNDLGLLGQQFNTMTSALKQAQDTNEISQRQLAQQKAFLETIMDNLTSGVVTLDHQGRLQTCNRNAGHILDMTLTAKHNAFLPEKDKQPSDSYEELIQALLPRISASEKNWQQEITLNRFGTRKILMCHGSRLPNTRQRIRGGHVIVFDDITDYLQHQRNAAWEEVARRLAHEIKNPLTPIRLQTERLQNKLADKLSDDKDKNILNRATTTIINQVDAMKEIVTNFSQFAKPLQLRRKPLDLNELIKELGELYPENNITFTLNSHLPMINADTIQLRQVFHNLMKNAIEAGEQQTDLQIILQTSVLDNHVVFSIEDNGPGFADLAKDPFEPYVTNKKKGTGLGLAIVKKIINEHGGNIQAGHSTTLDGAKITITLPIYKTGSS